MYAVFRSGGKQYRAAKGDVLRLEKIEADEGATVKFDEVLLVGEGSDIKVGSPLLSGSTVSGKVVRQGKSKKVPVVKFKRRQNYLRQGSHRQFFTEVEITGITGGSAKKAAPKPPAGDKKKRRGYGRKAGGQEGGDQGAGCEKEGGQETRCQESRRQRSRRPKRRRPRSRQPRKRLPRRRLTKAID